MTEPCQNNGTCSSDVAGYSCNCTELWTGTNCTISLYNPPANCTTPLVNNSLAGISYR